jgi:5-hydroxyisourate hydrolase
MISTHILDLGLGQPAVGVAVELEKQTASGWKQIGLTDTNTDGRIQFQCAAEAGTYRLVFKIDDYLNKLKQTPFFTIAPVTFQITDTSRRYHIPLLLNQFGYSTYRGS